ncbi:hypothetical protein IV102_05730 [bacterium]|nr:hypothetical protein [bacterium]
MKFERLLELESWQWPPTATGVLTTVVKDRTRPTPDRVQAAQLLGDSGSMDDEAAHSMLSVVTAAVEPDEVRDAALLALGPMLEASEDTDLIGSDSHLSEPALREVKKRIRDLFGDASQPVLLRRRALEVAVRAPEGWHRDAVREAFASPERDWQLTAVFCMRFVRGFNKQILQALEGRDDEILYEAVMAAGAFEVKEAWCRVASLATAQDTDKDLRLAAIESIATIQPKKAPEILLQLIGHRDDDIAAAAEEALAMAEGEYIPSFRD